MLGFDFHHRDVERLVIAEQFGGETPPVAQGGHNLAGPFDHMEIGHHMTLLGNDRARALRKCLRGHLAAHTEQLA